MKRISCVIFDIDGTLAQTNELIYASFNHIAERYVGRTFSPQEIAAMFGPPEGVAIERLVGSEHSSEAMNEFCDFYDTHHPKMAGAYKGIKEILEFLKGKGVLLAVFTGKGKRTTLITLKHIDLMDYFDIIVTGDDVTNHKPSAEGIRKVVNMFALEPTEVLMVGDSVSDIKAARDAGVAIGAVVWDSYGKEKVLQMDVDHLFHSVGDFFDWLKTSFPVLKAREA
jgi:HAD superfamily hydrolase (TIGR01549 family)